MKIKILAIGAALAVAGCANMADSFDKMSGVGSVTKEVSQFDGTTSIQLDPAFLFDTAGSMTGVPIKLGAHWSETQPDSVDLVLSYSSSTISGTAFVGFEGIDINVDGEISKFRTNSFTMHTNSGYNTVGRTIYTDSKNAVTVPLSFVKQMTEASDCRVRIYTSDGYVDANFSIERSTAGQAAARLRFREFLSAVNPV